MVEPLGIVLTGGAWYLVAQSEGHTRTFCITRISRLDVLERRFTYPKAFDLAAYWSESSRQYKEGLHPNRAEVGRDRRPAGRDRWQRSTGSLIAAGEVAVSSNINALARCCG